MQVTLARRVAPTHPYHCRRNGQTRRALLSWDSTSGQAAAMPTSPLHWVIYWYPPCSVASRGPVPVGAGCSLDSSLCPLCSFWVPNSAQREWLPAREAGERERKGWRGSQGLTFGVFVQFSIASLMVVDSHPRWGKPLSSAYPECA